MKRFSIVILNLCLMGCFLIGCGKSEDSQSSRTMVQSGKDELAGCPASADDAIYAQLARMGLCEGMTKNKDCIISVGTHEIELRDPEKCGEVLRQVTYRKALIGAMCSIALCVMDRDDLHSEDEIDTSCATTSSKQFFELPLYGLSVLTSAESYDAEDGVYEVALAVLWSKKSVARAESIVLGEATAAEQKPGSKSIVEWIDDNAARPCSTVFVDNVGDRWLVGSVLVDAAMRQYVENWCDVGGSTSIEWKLKAYVLDEISKLVACDVEFYRESSFYEKNQNTDKWNKLVKNYEHAIIGGPGENRVYQWNGESGEALKSTWRDGDELIMVGTFKDATEASVVFDKSSVKTGFRIHPENARLKWFKRKGINPVSKKEIEVWIGAIRCDDIDRGEKERMMRKLQETKLRTHRAESVLSLS